MVAEAGQRVVGQLDEAIKAIRIVRQRHPTHEDSALLERQLLQEQQQKR